MSPRNVVAAALLLLPLAAPPAAAAEVLLDPALDRGDAKAAFEALLSAVEADPLDARVPLVLRDLQAVWDFVPHGKATALARLEPVLKRAEKRWNGDDLRSAVAALRWASGDREGGEALQSARGWVDAYLVCGPFGMGRQASLEETFEPEVAAAGKTFSPRQRFRAMRGSRTWQPVEREPLRGSISLNGILSGGGAVSYAVSHLRFEEETRGTLVYSGPSAKVWLGRSLVSFVDRSRERLSQEVRIPVTFRAGWNRLLLKVSGGARTSFALRCAGEGGQPLAFESSSEPRPVDVDGASLEPPFPTPTLEALSREVAPERRALYAMALLEAGLSEEALTVLEDLTHSDPGLAEQPWLLLLRGRAVEEAGHLPRSSRRELARRAYRAALERDPKSVFARQRLATFLIQDDRLVEGIQALEAILEGTPGDLRTRLQLFSVLREKEWLLAAERLLDAAGPAAQGLPPMLRSRIRVLTQRGRRAEAQALRERLYELSPADTWVLLQRVDAAADRGDAAAARAALEEFGRLADETAFGMLNRKRRLAARLGDRQGELEALRGAAQLRPWDVGLRLQLATLLAESPDDAEAKGEAVLILDEALAEEPGIHWARQLRQALGGEEDRFWEEWAPDVEKVLADAPDASHWPKASSVCLFDQQVTRIYPDTSAVDVIHQIWRLLDQGGIERYGARPQSGELLEIRTLTPSGEVLEPIRAGNGPFQMPGLAPGALIEHAFKTQSGKAGFQYSGGPFYFQDPDLTEPFWLSRWVLIIHKDAPVRIVERNMNRKGITKTVEERGDWVVTTYVANNQPRLQPEPGAPDKDEYLPWVKLIEERDLGELGVVYRERGVRDAPTPSVARKAEEVCFGLSTDAQRARALYDFVQSHVTRGAGGNSAAQILAARGGSKTTLLLGLLDAARVPHDLVLAAPQPTDAIDWRYPEPSHFRVPVVRLPGEHGPVYVFAEAHKFSPFGRLPAELWDAPAYVCDPVSGGLDVLPSEPLGAEATRTETSLVLGAGGSVRGNVRRVLPAFGLFRLKELFGTLPEQQLRGWFARQANELFPGARVTRRDLPRREEAGVPLTVVFDLEADGVLRPRGDGTFELRGLIQPSGLLGRYGNRRLRVFDLLLSGLWAVGGDGREVVRVDLGPYACPRLPESVTIESRFGQFCLLFSREGPGRLRVERRIMLRPGRVLARDYPEFRAFLERIDQAERAILVLSERGGAG